MKIFVKAKAGAKENKIIPPALKLIPDQESWYIASVKERPIKNLANQAIIKLLAEYFKIPKSQIKLITGQTSKKKIFEITPG